MFLICVFILSLLSELNGMCKSREMLIVRESLRLERLLNHSRHTCGGEKKVQMQMHLAQLIGKIEINDDT